MNQYWGLVEVDHSFQAEKGDRLLVENGIVVDIIPRDEYIKREKSLKELSEKLKDVFNET